MIDRNKSVTPDSPIFVGSRYVLNIDLYTEAWEKLSQTNGPVLPILFLQRHTFELLVKEVLLSVLDKRSNLHALDEIFGTPRAGPVDQSDLKTAYNTHRFSFLFDSVEKNLDALGCKQLPGAFREACKFFCRVDNDEPDKLRYETQRRNGRIQRSFKTTVEAPIKEVASLLRQIMMARLRSLGADPPSESELASFYATVWDYHEESVSRLGEVTAATREGGIKWRKVSSECLNIKAHAELKDSKKNLADSCFETQFRDQDLIIAVLENIVSDTATSSREDAYFLAARHTNGTLTSGVWLDGHYGDNLLYECEQAAKP